jgi:DNA-binding transcriptional MerR regulator
MKLEELAQRAGISARTVRYYVQRGLLPPPAFRGKDSSYGASHLLRLNVIRALQAAFYPLETIKGLLASKDDAALTELLTSPRAAPPQLGEPVVSQPCGTTHHGRGSASPAGFPAGERWRKIVLTPGVELLVREGAIEDARVRRVVAMFEEEDDS